MKSILILLSRGYFLTGSLTEKNKAIDVVKVKDLFEEKNFKVRIENYENINNINYYRNWYVIYGSDEENGLFYKSYIEDFILALEQVGAVVLPRYEMLRAHHNKSYMEIRRTTFMRDCLKTIQSRSFSSWDSLSNSDYYREIKFPVVVKPSAGAGSNSVFLAKNIKNLEKAVKKIQKVYFHKGNISSLCTSNHLIFLRKARRIIKHNTAPVSPQTEKFIIQNFVNDLDGDFKVLVFLNKYYVLRRENRENDFRASGSGKFTFPGDGDSDVNLVLDFVRDFYTEMRTPLLSVDVGLSKGQCCLIEYQCLNFGPYTLQYSNWWFEYGDNDAWVKHIGKSTLEDEYVSAISGFIEKNYEEQNE